MARGAVYTPIAPDEEAAGLLDMPSWFVERGGTIHQFAAARQIWRSLPPGLTARQLEVLRGTVFVLLKPDGLASGKGELIFGRLRDRGGRLLHVSTTDGAHEGAFEELYEFNLNSTHQTNMVGAWWLNQRIYAIGPSVIALMYFAPSQRGRATAHEIVRELKGPADLRRVGRGQLRHDLAHAAPGLNLMHSADDPLRTAREFLLFRKVDALTTALDRVTDPESPRDLDSSAESDTIESQGWGQVDLDFVRAMVRLKLRTIGLVTDGHPTATLEECLRRQRILLHHDGEFASRWSTYQELCERELATSHAGEAHSLIGTDDRIREHFSIFNSPKTYDTDTARRLWAHLNYLRVPVSAWEKLIVDLSMHYSEQFPQ